MTRLDAYEERFDEPMRTLFRSAIVAAKNRRINRLTLTALIDHLFDQRPDLLGALLARIAIDTHRFRERLAQRTKAEVPNDCEGIRIDQDVIAAFRQALNRARANSREKITVEDLFAVLGQRLDGSFMEILIELGAHPYTVASTVVDLLNEIDRGLAPPVTSEQAYRIGEIVRILDGPFAAAPARVENVDVEKSQLTVVVKLLGTQRIVLNFAQIQKLGFN